MILSISEFLNQLRVLIEKEQPHARVQGEISQPVLARSGHAYFTLKDEKVQLSVVMWAREVRKFQELLREGSQVICSGRPTIYAGQGRLQFVADELELLGEGALRAQFEKLKAKLEKEGLFDQSRKRKLPLLPTCLGIVTSKTGAVIHDIQVKINERFPGMQFIVEDVPVQGEGASKKIALGIEKLSANRKVDVIIVARGGGSLEDLWSFNEEVVVRAVFASNKPVVSGVGHETDTTLCDLVADLRAPTPTAAAEMVVPRLTDLQGTLRRARKGLQIVQQQLFHKMQSFDIVAERLTESAVRNIERQNAKLSQLSARSRSLEPERVLSLYKQKLISNHMLLKSTTERNLKQRVGDLIALTRQMRLKDLRRNIDEHRVKVRQLQREFQRFTVQVKEKKTIELKAHIGRLLAASPQSILGRGYALVFDHRGQLIKNSKNASKSLTIQFNDAALDVNVSTETKVTFEERLKKISENIVE